MSEESLYVGPPPGSQELRANAAPALAWAPVVVLAAAFAHNVVLGWRAWGDPVIDGGRELEVARQLAEGQRLYADVRYYYGPLAPYLNAALFRIFGTDSGVLMGAGLVSAALMCALLYALGARLAGRLGATVAAAAFLYLCAFAHLYHAAIFNWVLPYAFPATYGMLAATASLYLLVRHVALGRRVDLALSVVCLGLAALAKLEAFLPAAAVHGVFAVTTRRGWRPMLRPYLLVAAVVAAVHALFGVAVGRGLFTGNLTALFNPGALPVILRFAGLADWPATGIALLESSLAFVTVVLATVGLGRLVRRQREARLAPLVTAVGSAAVAIVVYTVLPPHRAFRMLPLLLVVLVTIDWRRARRGPAPESEALARLLLWTFALASLARMPLVAGAPHYGFYLLPVPLIALAAFWLRVAPRAFSDRGLVPSSAVCAGVAMIAAIAVPTYRESREFYARHTVHVRAPRGEMYLLADVGGYPVGQTYAEAIERLATFAPETRVLALPQGVGLGFLAGLRSWDGMHSVLPPELPSPDADARLVAHLERDHPDVVLWIGMDLGEYGTAGFGVDYAVATLAWVKAHYRTTAALGPRGYVLVMTPAPDPLP
jgi:hypothetical protein